MSVKMQQTFELIDVAKIVPNGFNSNHMSRKKFDEYVAEVNRLGRLPKPTVVRRRTDGSFEIVDGEHGWRAAKKLGLPQIQCEIIKADTFEAMTQCYKRNRGGKDNRLLLGRMFEQMTRELAEKNHTKPSVRKLAREIVVPESTIRFHLGYVMALKVRKLCAGDDADRQIAKLNGSQVSVFNKFPPDFSNKWLDAGGELWDLQATMDEPMAMRVDWIMHCGLTRFLDPQSFRASIDDMFAIAKWCKSHRLIDSVEIFAQTVAERNMPCAVMDCLPCGKAADEKIPVLITVKQWAAILGKCADRYDSVFTLRAAVQFAVQAILQEEGHDLSECAGPIVAAMRQGVEQAPECIRTADCLTLEERYWLAQKLLGADGALVGTAVERTCEAIQRLRTRSANRNGKPKKQRPESVQIVYAREREALNQENEDEFFEDDQAVFTAISSVLLETSAISSTAIGDRPASEVLAERLENLDWPEIYLLTSLVVAPGQLEDAATRWVDSASTLDQEATNEPA